MGTRLLKILTFTNVPPAGVAVLPHTLNIAGTPIRPDFVVGDQTDFMISANSLVVAVTNNGAVMANIDVWVERKHTIPRELGGGVDDLTPQPFIVTPGTSTAAPATEITGSTPGAGVGESVALLYPGLVPITFVDGHGYSITATIIARGNILGVPQVQSFQRTYALRKDAGLTTLAAIGMVAQVGDAAADSWNVVASIGAAPDQLLLTFNTGLTTSAVVCVGDLYIVDADNP